MWKKSITVTLSNSCLPEVKFDTALPRPVTIYHPISEVFYE